jgi:hypothetical protein
MSKKHFIELADTMRETRPSMTHEHDGDATAAFKQWEQMRDALALFCRRENSRFNSERWYDYIDGKCGPSGGALK